MQKNPLTELAYKKAEKTGLFTRMIYYTIKVNKVKKKRGIKWELRRRYFATLGRMKVQRSAQSEIFWQKSAKIYGE
jgi:hypothetical protein